MLDKYGIFHAISVPVKILIHFGEYVGQIVVKNLKKFYQTEENKKILDSNRFFR